MGHDVAWLRELRGRLRERAWLAATFLWRRLMLRTTVVAITGSVGKTTAKECLAAVLEPVAPTLKTFQNENDTAGVPRTIRRMRPWHRFAVVEVGSGGPGDLRRLGRLLRPDVAIVLGVARTHTNRFRTLEATALEKAALLRCVRRRGRVLLNADDRRVRAMAARSRARVRFFGCSADCEVRADEVEARWPDRLRFTAHGRGGPVAVRTRLVGAHWVPSALAALAAGEACGVPLADAAPRLTAVAPFMGRMQPVSLPNGACLVRDEETASPDTLDAMLEVLKGARARRRGLVFSDLSDSRAKPRKRLGDMGRLAARCCDFAVFVGEHRRHARRAALAAGLDAARCPKVEGLRDAAAWLAKSLGPGDLVFLKGRSCDHLSRILFAQFGEIGCWKTFCRVRRLCDVCRELRPRFDADAVLAAHARRPREQ